MFNSWSGRLVAALLGALLCAPAALAQTKPAPAAATGPWAKVPPLSTGCFQYVATSSPDPFYAKLEAAKAALSADSDRQAAINAKIEEEFNNIDPMEKAQRMQQWMMSNPEEAMAYMQGVQAAPAEGQAELESHEQQRASNQAEWNALKKRYDDARLKAYAPIEARRKALAGRLGYAYSAAPKDLVEPVMNFYQDSSTPTADWNEGELITAEFDRAYKALCPQWWGANGPFHAYLKKQKDWFVRERVPYLEKTDAPKLQQYGIMSTSTATYRSTAAQQAANEYLDLVYKVFGERDNVPRCELPKSCDGTYP